MANKKEYNEGYNDAIEAIKKILNGQGSSEMDSQDGTTDDGRDMDLGNTPAGQKQQQQQRQQSGGSSGSGSKGEDSESQGGGGQGTVTPEDCAGQFADNVPSTPGGFMDGNEGNKLAEEEGYEPGPTGDAMSNQWKEVAIRAAQKAQGNAAGSFASKIMGIWKTTTDWKKSFRKIVGRALNTSDRRSAFANKNILATQNRVARTDKDKFDAVDYMCIFTDSSGSISDNDLKYMLSEIYQIALQLKPETLVVGQFDTRIQDIKVFRDAAEFRKYANVAQVKGRGGTECKCIWDLLHTDKRFKGTQSELVIIITDGYLTQYKRDPKTMGHLCWAILDNAGWECNNKETKTSTIHLDSKDIKK